MQKKYSLQTIISLLFITITVAIAVILSWQSFTKTSDMMLNSAKSLYVRSAHELSLDFAANYSSVAKGLNQFRLSPVIKANSFKQRIHYLVNFQAVLTSEPAVFAVGVGYENGDYIGVTWSDADYVQAKYRVPDGATFVVFYLNKTQDDIDTKAGFDAGKLYAIYVDSELNEISRNEGEDSKFDPRLRPWYQQATAIPSATKPYLFYESKIVGLTVMSKTVESGVVVVFDITLRNLSHTLAKHQMTPNSEVVLINADGETFAYKDQQKVVQHNSDGSNQEKIQLAHLDQLDSGVLTHVANNFVLKEQDLDFEYKGARWIGSSRIVAKPGGINLYALMLSPVDELLADAIKIRNRLIFIAFIVLIIFLPIVWLTARKISTPLNLLAREAEAITRFDFAETRLKPSFIKEVDALDFAMESMKTTINQFIKLIDSLAGEQDLDVLLKSITKETMLISKSDGALIYLLNERDDLLRADFLCDKDNTSLTTSDLPDMKFEEVASFFSDKEASRVIRLDKQTENKLIPLLDIFNVEVLTSIVLPLKNRNDEIIGVLYLLYEHSNAIEGTDESQGNIAFVEALSGFAAVTLESRQLFTMQEALLHAFIKLIAGAIDAKSPYTSGHCQRVPEITFMLAEAACQSDSNQYKNFELSEKQWQELRVACWLHDCGKVTTPEYVVDKATKLETIYDRIHEVRTRFEVLKRDAEIVYWQKIVEGDDKHVLLMNLKQKLKKLDDDFAFVAECNVGGEFMADEKIERLQKIAERTWLRTLDDNLGLSWEELDRKEKNTVSLPIEEKLLSDKSEHLIARYEVDKMPKDNAWGFKVDTPEYKYNRGELYNLSVKRGTLSEEERYMINGHMIQTIIMLNNLPFPKHLKNVPLIAGSHHETMDGKGYPKRLVMSEQPLTARMMVIADIFEALTASDRPYKKAKTLTDSLRILSFMRDDKHVDADLFDLFLTSGVYLDYAN
ncbi:MAG: hypothetical protein JKX75_10095, partial [Gammaproteobacteria bacterium]|nr:hypothetical protein [Gammaproteobacteria bacterium]